MASTERLSRCRPSMASIAQAKLERDARDDTVAISRVQEAIDMALAQLGRRRARKLLVEAWGAL